MIYHKHHDQNRRVSLINLFKVAVAIKKTSFYVIIYICNNV